MPRHPGMKNLVQIINGTIRAEMEWIMVVVFSVAQLYYVTVTEKKKEGEKKSYVMAQIKGYRKIFLEPFPFSPLVGYENLSFKI